MEIETASDSSLLVRFGESASDSSFRAVTSLFRSLRAAGDPRVRNIHPAYASVLIDFDPLQISHEEIRKLVADSIRHEGEISDPLKIVQVPVCYETEFGIDTAFVAEHSDLSQEDVVRMHHSAAYVVCFIGFSPGFAYLGGLPHELECPRLESPRKHVAAGSVGIAGSQTGIYPVDSPGGWRIIGRTPLRMFDPLADPPTQLQPGDAVRFVPINRAEFEKLAKSESGK
jgi:KipI family sensor histidine kinase inhibitor